MAETPDKVWDDIWCQARDLIVDDDASRLRSLFDRYHGFMSKRNIQDIFRLARLNNGYECVKFMLENIDGVDITGRGLFEQSCQDNSVDIVALLVTHGADPRIESDAAVYWSAQSGNIDVLKYLVKYSGLDNDKSRTMLEKEALELAVRLSAESGHTEVVAYLDSIGIDLHHNREQALRNAAKDGHIDTVKLITSRPVVDIDAVDGGAIKFACLNGHVNVVSHLIDMGACVHVSDDGPIKLAVTSGHLEVIDLLFKQDPGYFTNLFKTDKELLGIDMAQSYLAERLLNRIAIGNRKRRSVKI